MNTPHDWKDHGVIIACANCDVLKTVESSETECEAVKTLEKTSE